MMSDLAMEIIKKEKYEKTGKLDLGRCGLREIPEELFKLTWLEELSFCNEIWDLKNREWINSPNSGTANNINIEKLPEAFQCLAKLKKLFFGGGRNTWKLKECNIIGKLENIQTLDLSSNKITDNSFLEKLTGLQSLELSYNKITDCSFLEKLTRLQYLYLSYNKITDCSFLDKLTGLQSLYLSNNKITDISFLEKLTRLQSLDLSNNKITDCSFLEKLTGLQSLDLSANQITDCSFLDKLTGLQYLYLSDNKITDCSFLDKLTELQSLNLRYNKITYCSFLEKLTGLQSLYLRYNQITDISFLEKLTRLQSLDLSDNQITDISFLEKLTGLQSLDLSYNQITDIKPLLPLIKSGRALSTETFGAGILLGDNPISSPPMKIIEKGREAVLNWFEQMVEGTEPLYEAKLMILGQGGAGKTTFAELLLDSDYQVEPGKIDSTLGVVIHKGKEFNHQSLGNQKIKAHLWDFGGQDIQKMLHQFFITENCLYILVSDKRAENCRFDYWFQIVHLLGPKSSVIVLENPIKIESANKDFPLTKYRENFSDLSIDSHEVNLIKTREEDETKWKLLIENIEKELSSLEIVNRSVPKKWTFVRDELEKLQGRRYISKDDFYTICTKPEIGLTEEHADLCLFYLNELGDLVYFDDRGLSNNIFLDHNWLTQGMYYILSSNKIKDNKGEFTRQQAYEQWGNNNYNEAEKEMLLNLLLKDKFDICYEIKDQKDHFITPLLLPNDKPEKWEYETNLHFRYQYGFIPHGMFSRLIVRIHEKIDGHKRWETGVRLIDQRDAGTVWAEVQQFTVPDTNQIVIDIKLNGDREGCKQLLNFVRAELKHIHKDYMNVPFTEIVCCNCETCSDLVKKGETPSFYDYEKLQHRIKYRKYFIDCEKSNFEDVNVGGILSDILIESMAKDNMDNVFMHQLKEMGINMHIIKNEVNPNFNVASTSSATATAKATNKISIEIQNMLGETGMLKEDIERELKIKKLPEEEIELAKSDIDLAEEAIKEIETAQKQNKEPAAKSKSRLKQFIDDLSDEESAIHKTLKLLRRGKNYGVNLAEGYNKIAKNIGLTSVPPVALDIIRKL